MYKLGVQSLPLVSIVGLFTGMVLALQMAYEMKAYGVADAAGGIVAASITRELGPVLAAIMLAARVGSGIAAELGTMRVTEQIDAMDTLGTDPMQYLIVPRVLACVLMAPILTIYFDFIANFGGYMIAVYKVGLSGHIYLSNIDQILDGSQILGGLLKSLFFGLFVGMLGSFNGFNCSGGAEGVGRSTINAVVAICMMIFIIDYYLSAVLFVD